MQGRKIFQHSSSRIQYENNKNIYHIYCNKVLESLQNIKVRKSNIGCNSRYTYLMHSSNKFQCDVGKKTEIQIIITFFTSFYDFGFPNLKKLKVDRKSPLTYFF